LVDEKFVLCGEIGDLNRTAQTVEGSVAPFDCKKMAKKGKIGE